MEEIGTMINKYKYLKQDELIENLSLNIIKNLEDAILNNGYASLMVSGGSTPKPLFEKLSSIDISWDKVSIGLCDERWLDNSHQDSNEKFVKSTLLKNFATKAKFVPLYQANKNIEECEISCSESLKENIYPFDVVILGMGTDGHTASLFPNNEKIKSSLDLKNENLCVSMIPDEAPYHRMSLTRAAILSANNIYLHFEGEKK